MKRNAWGKTRKAEAPYAVVVEDGWEWRVLKAYKSLANEEKDPFARWLCAVRSPGTFGGWDYGDVYCKRVPLTESLLDALAARAGEEERA